MLSDNSVCERLNISHTTLRRLRKVGKAPASHMIGSQYRTTEDALEAYEAATRVGHHEAA